MGEELLEKFIPESSANCVQTSEECCVGKPEEKEIWRELLNLNKVILEIEELSTVLTEKLSKVIREECSNKNGSAEETPVNTQLGAFIREKRIILTASKDRIESILYRLEV